MDALTPDTIREAIGTDAEGWTDDQLRNALRDAMISLGLIEEEAA